MRGQGQNRDGARAIDATTPGMLKPEEVTRGRYRPLQPFWLDQTGTPSPLTRHAAPGGQPEAFEEVLYLARQYDLVDLWS
jgi:hypothetical protein